MFEGICFAMILSKMVGPPVSAVSAAALAADSSFVDEAMWRTDLRGATSREIRSPCGRRSSKGEERRRREEVAAASVAADAIGEKAGSGGCGRWGMLFSVRFFFHSLVWADEYRTYRQCSSRGPDGWSVVPVTLRGDWADWGARGNGIVFLLMTWLAVRPAALRSLRR